MNSLKNINIDDYNIVLLFIFAIIAYLNFDHILFIIDLM